MYNQRQSSWNQKGTPQNRFTGWEHSERDRISTGNVGVPQSRSSEWGHSERDRISTGNVGVPQSRSSEWGHSERDRLSTGNVGVPQSRSSEWGHSERDILSTGNVGVPQSRSSEWGHSERDILSTGNVGVPQSRSSEWGHSERDILSTGNVGVPQSRSSEWGHSERDGISTGNVGVPQNRLSEWGHSGRDILSTGNVGVPQNRSSEWGHSGRDRISTGNVGVPQNRSSEWGHSERDILSTGNVGVPQSRSSEWGQNRPVSIYHQTNKCDTSNKLEWPVAMVTEPVSSSSRKRLYVPYSDTHSQQSSAYPWANSKQSKTQTKEPVYDQSETVYDQFSENIQIKRTTFGDGQSYQSGKTSYNKDWSVSGQKQYIDRSSQNDNVNSDTLVKNLDLNSILPDNQLKALKSIFNNLQSPTASKSPMVGQSLRGSQQNSITQSISYTPETTQALSPQSTGYTPQQLYQQPTPVQSTGNTPQQLYQQPMPVQSTSNTPQQFYQQPTSVQSKGYTPQQLYQQPTSRQSAGYTSQSAYQQAPNINATNSYTSQQGYTPKPAYQQPSSAQTAGAGYTPQPAYQPELPSQTAGYIPQQGYQTELPSQTASYTPQQGYQPELPSQTASYTPQQGYQPELPSQTASYTPQQGYQQTAPVQTTSSTPQLGFKPTLSAQATASGFTPQPQLINQQTSPSQTTDYTPQPACQQTSSTPTPGYAPQSVVYQQTSPVQSTAYTSQKSYQPALPTQATTYTPLLGYHQTSPAHTTGTIYKPQLDYAQTPQSAQPHVQPVQSQHTLGQISEKRKERTVSVSSETALEKDVITSLSSVAVFELMLQPPPPPEGTTVYVNKLMGTGLFNVTGHKVVIENSEYEDRITYSGNIRQGIIKFSLSDVRYEDEGLYIASYKGIKSEKKHLKISIGIQVTQRKTADLCWNIDPGGLCDIVDVYKSNGNHILTAYGVVAHITEEYINRVKFTGNTFQGIIRFSLYNCNLSDFGMYMSSCHNKEVKGRQLYVKAFQDFKAYPTIDDQVVMLGQDTIMNWFIPPVSSAIVTISNRGRNVLVRANNKSFSISSDYKERLKFKGNVTQGIVSFTLMNCSYKDEGSYVAEYIGEEYPGPKLEIATLLSVKMNVTAQFHWRMKPSTTLRDVKVYKANGSTLFVASGTQVLVEDEYISRINYYGNTLDGNIQFSLRGCTLHDNGLYIASCHGVLQSGKLLQVQDPAKETVLQQAKHNPGLFYASKNGESTFQLSHYCIINEMSYIKHLNDGETTYDNSVLNLRIKEGGTAYMCWHIKPVKGDVMVKVYRADDSPLFIASGKMAIEHSNRVKFTGDTTSGLMEFILSDCTTGDAGYYHSSHDIENYKGKYLRVIGSISMPDVSGLLKDDIVLKWPIEPAYEGTKVTVSKKDGGTVFTASGSTVLTSEAYRGRIRFIGSTTDGVIAFKLINCQFEDEGLYLASYDEFVFRGPKLKLSLPHAVDVDANLGGTARVKFHIKPEPKHMLVTISLNNRYSIFSVYGDKVYYIKPSLSDRFHFFGDPTEGRIEFMLENCNYEDEGEYGATISDGTKPDSIKRYQGPKLTINLPQSDDVYVALDATATVKWYIRPVPPKPNTSTVTIYFKNGANLFTVYGDRTFFTSEYQGRIEYTGDVTKGIVQFKLKNCLYKDEGQFAASYDGRIFPGPKLILRTLPIPDIVTSLTGTAIFKWFMRPAPEGTWVTVSRRDGDTLFVIMGKFTDIREAYKERIAVTGDISLGIVEFVLDKCNYSDEGTYVVTYKDQQFIGPKLVLTLEVNDREAAPLCWDIEPVPVNRVVKVFRKNGLDLFTANGKRAAITAEFDQRVIFTGDTRTGKIAFVLKDCSHGDTGLYMSSYEDKICDGRHLIVKLLDDEMEKEKNLLKLKLMIVMECLNLSKCDNCHLSLNNASATAELKISCNFQSGATTFPSVTNTAIAPAFTGVMYIGDNFKVPLTYAFGRNEDEVETNLYTKAVYVLKTKSVDKILNVENVKQIDFSGGRARGLQDHKVEYYYKTSADVCTLLSNLDNIEGQRVFTTQLVEDPNVKDEMFAKAAKLLYDSKKMSLLVVVNAIKQREIQKAKKSLRSLASPTLEALLAQPDVHSNVLELTKLQKSKSDLDFVIFDHVGEQQRLLGAFNCLSECAKKCGILLMWCTKVVYGEYTALLPRPVYRCNIWIQGKQVAEAFSIGRKFSIQLAAAEALAYLYQSQPVIQKVYSETKSVYSYTASKILKDADLLNKDLSLNERVLIICEGAILQFRSETDGTLESLDFYPGLQEHVYSHIKTVCTKNNLVYQTSSSLNEGPAIIISHDLDPYEIVTILGKHNGAFGKYRLIPAVERVKIAREILMRTKNVLELLPEDYAVNT